MIIYINTYTARSGDGSSGFSYHPSLRKARREARNRIGQDCCETRQVRIDISRKGILQALNRYAIHNDNG